MEGMKIIFVLLVITFGANAQLPQTANEVGGCHYEGTLYAVGQSWTAIDGCNTCYCSPYAMGFLCSREKCVTTKPMVNLQSLATCTYNKARYVAGDRFMSMDGCNTCTCSSTGRVSCTEAACNRGSCDYYGKMYYVGQMFDDRDGCNTCHCVTHSSVACTKMYCLPILQQP